MQPWTWLASAMAAVGRKKLAAAAAAAAAAAPGAVGLPGLPGGVLVESTSPWGLPAAGEAGVEGTEVMQAVHAAADACFAGAFAVDPLSGEATGWFAVVDLAVGPDVGMGVPLVDGADVDAELACLAEALPAIASEATLAMTIRAASPAPLPLAGSAVVRLEPEPERGASPEARAALQFERRAAETALACARDLGPPPSGEYEGEYDALDGVPQDFADCWAARAPALEPWIGDSAAFTLRYVAP